MVSTPIGSSPTEPTPTSHTFPVLCGNPLITTTTPLEVQPVSLYSEYIDNPYNVHASQSREDLSVLDGKPPVDASALWAQYLYQKHELQCQNKMDANRNTNEQHMNTASTDMFKSSNYFSIEANAIPPGSEILFGNGQGANIPVFTNPNSSS